MPAKLSPAESFTWEVIQDNYQKIPEISITKLSEIAHVSISTVNRTVRKKGFKGYTDFRHSIVRNISHANYKGFSSEVVEAISKNEEETLLTLNNISVASTERAVELMDKAEEILLFSRGLSSNVADELLKKIQLFHKKVSSHNDAAYMSYYANFVDDKTLIIILSLTGETQEIIRAAKVCKQRQAKMITITVSQGSTLGLLADICLTGYKSPLEVNYFSLDTHSRLPLSILCRVLIDSYSIYRQHREIGNNSK